MYFVYLMYDEERRWWRETVTGCKRCVDYEGKTKWRNRALWGNAWRNLCLRLSAVVKQNIWVTSSLCFIINTIWSEVNQCVCVSGCSHSSSSSICDHCFFLLGIQCLINHITCRPSSVSALILPHSCLLHYFYIQYISLHLCYIYIYNILLHLFYI